MIINYSDQEVIKGKKSIFLAGPTPRNENVKSWRKEACKLLEEKGFDGVVYVPEYSDGKPLMDYLDQVEWEREALSNASVIAFWIPRELKEMPAFTTNVEFGYWIHTGRIIYGRPDEARKNKYLDWLYKKDVKKDAKVVKKDQNRNSVAKKNNKNAKFSKSKHNNGKYFAKKGHNKHFAKKGHNKNYKFAKKHGHHNKHFAKRGHNKHFAKRHNSCRYY